MRLLDEGLRPDLLLTDVVMPGMSGIDLADAVEQRWPDLPVVLMSGYMEGYQGLEEIPGGRELIQKPFGGRDLIERIREAIERSEAMS